MVVYRDNKITKGSYLSALSPLCLPEFPEEGVLPVPQQNFIIPRKEINMVPDMAKWKRSQVQSTFGCSDDISRRAVLENFFRRTPEGSEGGRHCLGTSVVVLPHSQV